MFGGLKRPKKPVFKPRPIPKIVDVPGAQAGDVGHVGPEPNTCYNIKMMEYEQRKAEFDTKKTESLKQEIAGDYMEAIFMAHAAKRAYARDFNNRVNKRMQEFGSNIEMRRDKLRDVIWKEEREQIKEVVDTAQRAVEFRNEEIKQRLAQKRVEREVEEKQLAQEKRLLQYLDRCVEYRPVVERQRLIESKQVQLVQIRENESRKESERELDKLWHEMKLKEMAAKKEREEQDALHKKKRQAEIKQCVDLQLKALEIKREQLRRERIEEGIKIDKLREQVKQEKLAELEEVHRKRNETYESLNKQIKEHDELLKKQADDELAITRAYDKLADDEIEKLNLALKQKVSTAKQDYDEYMNYLKQLAENNRLEEERTNEIVKKTAQETYEKETANRCKDEIARRRLHETVMKEREKQIAYRRKHLEELKQKQEEENKAIRESWKHNGRLKEEQERQHKLKMRQYQEDLLKQAEYKKLLQKREREEEERVLASGVEEEEKYQAVVTQVMSGKIKIGGTHAFRQVLLGEKCPCPKTLY